MGKKPLVEFDTVVEWFKKAIVTTKAQGKKDSSVLWQDGLDYLLYLDADRKKLIKLYAEAAQKEEVV